MCDTLPNSTLKADSTVKVVQPLSATNQKVNHDIIRTYTEVVDRTPKETWEQYHLGDWISFLVTAAGILLTIVLNRRTERNSTNRDIQLSLDIAAKEKEAHTLLHVKDFEKREAYLNGLLRIRMAAFNDYNAVLKNIEFTSNKDEENLGGIISSIGASFLENITESELSPFFVRRVGLLNPEDQPNLQDSFVITKDVIRKINLNATDFVELDSDLNQLIISVDNIIEIHQFRKYELRRHDTYINAHIERFAKLLSLCNQTIIREFEDYYKWGDEEYTHKLRSVAKNIEEYNRKEGKLSIYEVFSKFYLGLLREFRMMQSDTGYIFQNVVLSNFIEKATELENMYIELQIFKQRVSTQFINQKNIYEIHIQTMSDWLSKQRRFYLKSVFEDVEDYPSINR